MRSYTTLGNGKNTKILCTPKWGEARSITTAPHENAKQIAFWLGRTDTQMWAALHPLAIALNGQPVEARRHLLGLYDSVAADPDSTAGRNGGDWDKAEQLVVGLAQATAGTPTPSCSAVRRELADHLTNLDGVLVPATIIAADYRPACLPLVISALFDPQATPAPFVIESIEDDDTSYPVGGPIGRLGDEYEWIDSCYGQRPAFDRYEQSSVESLIRDSDASDGLPYLAVRVDHLDAWARHHTPNAPAPSATVPV